MASAAIVIPVFRTTLHEFEYTSLRQCVHVFQNWPIYFVSPENLVVPAELTSVENKTIEVVRFPNEYFQGIEGYNRLMTLPAFYNAFARYEFMLIHQLDAFVFEDTLAAWCEKQYDYIGAPAFHATGFDALAAEGADQYATALNSHRLVFNGGLSLRKISAMTRLLRIYNLIYPSWKGNEDMLFSLSSTRLFPLKPFVKLPDWKEALRFAFEKSPAASYQILGEKLPFGCHAWQRYDPAFWKQFIA